eukprot:17130-Heterococcus_DN1.PRE.2
MSMHAAIAVSLASAAPTARLHMSSVCNGKCDSPYTEGDTPSVCTTDATALKQVLHPTMMHASCDNNHVMLSCMALNYIAAASCSASTLNISLSQYAYMLATVPQ